MVVLCAPYVEAEALLGLGLAHGSNVQIVTTDAAAGHLRASTVGLRDEPRAVLIVPHLHAKVYARWARDVERTEVVVTSANLTSAGLSRNLEFGVLARGDCPEGRRLIRQVERFLATLTPIRSSR